MQVIDIEARNAPRNQSPHASFRRTESDRRPATVVRRPNDGPGLLREKLAEERRYQLTLKTPSRPPTGPHAGGQRTDEFRGHMTSCVKAVLAGAEILPDIAEGFGLGLDRVRDFLSEACKLGLLTKALSTRKGRQYSVYSVTPAGEAFVSETGQ